MKAGRFVGTQIYEGRDSDEHRPSGYWCTPVAGMAESWTLSDDQLTWTFKLRQGQKFQDGTLFNADAVKFGLDRVIDKSSAFYNATLAAGVAQYVAGIASYSAVDETTFNIVTKRPYSFLLWDLAYLVLPSPTAVQTYGTDMCSMRRARLSA